MDVDVDQKIPAEPKSLDAHSLPPQKPDVKPPSPTTGIQKNMSALDVHPHTTAQVKSEPMDTSTVPVKTEPSAGTTSLVPLLNTIKPGDTRPKVDQEPTKEKTVKVEGAEEVNTGGSTRTLNAQYLPPTLRENSPEPKPDHAQATVKTEYSLIKVWNRNDNSCARTDLIFKAHSNSKLAAALQARLSEQASVSSKPSVTPNATASSSNSKTSKSPAPGKDEKVYIFIQFFLLNY